MSNGKNIFFTMRSLEDRFFIDTPEKIPAHHFRNRNAINYGWIGPIYPPCCSSYKIQSAYIIIYSFL